MIHYHGTPITPKIQLYKMAGKHFCVSFAHPSDVKTCLEIGQSVMFDCGSFSVFTRGLEVDFKKYYKWLEDKLSHPHWCLPPDKINGSIEDQKKLIKTFPFSKDYACPVWHIHLDISYLFYLVENYQKVCFGSSGEFWIVNSEKWRARMDYVFNELVKKYNKVPYIHMLRGLQMGGDKYPFASADSTNVARNFKDQNRCPEKMAREIDSLQTPVNWVQQPIQQQLEIGVLHG